MTSREARTLMYRLKFCAFAEISLRDNGTKVAEITRFINQDGTELFQVHHFIRKKFYIYDYKHMEKWLRIVPKDIVKIKLIKNIVKF